MLEDSISEEKEQGDVGKMLANLSMALGAGAAVGRMGRRITKWLDLQQVWLAKHSPSVLGF